MLLFKRLELFNPKFLLNKEPKLIKNYLLIGNILYNLFIHLKREFSDKVLIDTIEFSLVDLLSELAYFDFNLIYEEPIYAEKLFSKKVREFFLNELLNLKFIEELKIDDREKKALLSKFKKEKDIKEILEFYNSLRFSETKSINFYFYLKKEIFGYFDNKNEFIFEIIERKRSREFSIKSYLAFSLFYNLNLPKKTLLDFFNELFLQEKHEIEKESKDFSYLVDNFFNLINYETSEEKKAVLEKRKEESLKFLLDN